MSNHQFKVCFTENSFSLINDSKWMWLKFKVLIIGFEINRNFVKIIFDETRFYIGIIRDCALLWKTWWCVQTDEEAQHKHKSDVGDNMSSAFKWNWQKEDII